MKTSFAFASAVLLASAAFAAQPAAEKQLVKEEGRGRWTFSAGAAWRTRVKLETSGSVGAGLHHTGFTSTYLTDTQDPAQWGEVGTKPVPEKYYPMPDETAYSVDAIRRDVTTVAGADYQLGQSDTDWGMGVNIQGCYDFYQAETWAVGLNLRFAGYWNMKSEGSSGRYNGGYRATQDYRDSFLFMNGPYTWLGQPAPTPESGYLPETTADYSVPEGGLIVERFNTRDIATRLRGDLYQLGLGPKITWSPFEGWCRALSWLDVYASAEVLLNISRNTLDADGLSTTSTDCRVGFGGHAGFVGNITDWLGVYGQVGYEWVDKSEVSVGDFRGTLDYSSLVFAAGIICRF